MEAKKLVRGIVAGTMLLTAGTALTGCACLMPDTESCNLALEKAEAALVAAENAQRAADSAAAKAGAAADAAAAAEASAAQAAQSAKKAEAVFMKNMGK